MPPQQLYELHRRSSPKCPWFVQSNEALQALQQSAVQALQQQQHQQQAEEAFPTAAFECRRCPASFASNTKLHQHIRDHHAKRPKTSTSTSTPPPKPSAASPPWKAITDITHTPPRTSCLANHVTRPIFTPKPFAASAPSSKPPATSTPILTSPPSYPCLANHVTRPISTPKPSATSTPYLTVQDLYRMFHQKPRSSSRSAMATHLSSASPFGMPSRQTRITSYFKPIGYSTPPPPRKAALAPMRKYAHSRFGGQSTWISHLAIASPYTSIGPSTNSMASPFANGFSSLSSSWPHRSPSSGRKTCMGRPQHCCLHGMK